MRSWSTLQLTFVNQAVTLLAVLEVVSWICPEGAATYQPRATPWELDRVVKSALKGRNKVSSRTQLRPFRAGRILIRIGIPGRRPGLFCFGPFGAGTEVRKQFPFTVVRIELRLFYVHGAGHTSEPHGIFLLRNSLPGFPSFGVARDDATHRSSEASARLSSSHSSVDRRRRSARRCCNALARRLVGAAASR